MRNRKRETRNAQLTIISGTPGTGKTSAARLLGKLIGARVIHLREFVREKKLSSGYDRKTDSELVDLGKLKRALMREIARPGTQHRKPGTGNGPLVIVEGHLACEFALPAGRVFILRCRPGELKKRLSARKYAKAKLEANLLAEMLDYCVQKAGLNYPDAEVCEIETAGKGAAQTAGRLAALAAGKGKCDSPDYQKELKEFLKLR